MAQYACAAEWAEEQHPPLERVRNRNAGGRGSDISDEAEHLVFLVELLHRVAGPRRLVAVIGRY